MKPETRNSLAVLCAVPFIMVLGNAMLIPLLPKMKAAMDITFFQVGLLITVFSLPAGIIIPFAGFLSDRFGRKIVMIPALVLYGLGGLFSGASALFFSEPYYYIIAGRIIQGIGAGGTYQLAMALTGDIFQTKERAKALGILEAFNGLGKIISPITGSAVGLIAWFAPFFVYGVLALPIAAAVGLIAREPEGKKEIPGGKKYLEQLRKILKNKGVSMGTCFLSGMTALFILFGLLSFLADYLESEYGLRGIYMGLLIAIPVTFMTIASYTSGKLLQKSAEKKALKIAVLSGLGLMAASLAGQALLVNIYWFFFLASLTGIGTGVVLTSINTLITSVASAAERGLVTCFYGTTRFFGVAMGPPAFSLGMALGIKYLFLGAGVLTFIIALLPFFFLKEGQLLDTYSSK